MSDDDIKREVEEVMSNLDQDGSGMIDYSEWAVGTANKSEMLS